MYIVISGVHGAGKTTIAKELAKKIGGVYLTEAIDELIAPPQFGPKSKEKLASQFWHARQLLLKDQKMVDDSKKYVCDRGWADLYVYSRELLKDRDKDLFLSIIDHLPKRMPDIHFIVYASPEVLTERVESRNRDNINAWGEQDKKYAKKINDAFIKFAKDFGDLRPIHLIDIGGSIEESLVKMTDIINKNT